MLRAEEGVPIEKAVLVMDIANRNKYKVILAVRPKQKYRIEHREKIQVKDYVSIVHSEKREALSLKT